ncbi:hypothetical protein CAAN3_23S00474 [[Candida] anglica]
MSRRNSMTSNASISTTGSTFMRSMSTEQLLGYEDKFTKKSMKKTPGVVNSVGVKKSISVSQSIQKIQKLTPSPPSAGSASSTSSTPMVQGLSSSSSSSSSSNGGFHKTQNGAYIFPNGEVFRPRNSSSPASTGTGITSTATSTATSNTPPHSSSPTPKTFMTKSNSINNIKKLNLVHSLRATTNDTPTNIHISASSHSGASQTTPGGPGPNHSMSGSVKRPYQSTNVVKESASNSVVSLDDTTNPTHHNSSSDSNPSSLSNYNLNRSSTNTPTTSISNSIDEGTIDVIPEIEEKNRESKREDTHVLEFNVGIIERESLKVSSKESPKEIPEKIPQTISINKEAEKIKEKEPPKGSPSEIPEKITIKKGSEKIEETKETPKDTPKETPKDTSKEIKEINNTKETPKETKEKISNVSKELSNEPSSNSNSLSNSSPSNSTNHTPKGSITSEENDKSDTNDTNESKYSSNDGNSSDNKSSSQLNSSDDSPETSSPSESKNSSSSNDSIHLKDSPVNSSIYSSGTSPDNAIVSTSNDTLSVNPSKKELTPDTPKRSRSVKFVELSDTSLSSSESSDVGSPSVTPMKNSIQRIISKLDDPLHEKSQGDDLEKSSSVHKIDSEKKKVTPAPVTTSHSLNNSLSSQEYSTPTTSPFLEATPINEPHNTFYKLLHDDQKEVPPRGDLKVSENKVTAIRGSAIFNHLEASDYSSDDEIDMARSFEPERRNSVTFDSSVASSPGSCNPFPSSPAYSHEADTTLIEELDEKDSSPSIVVSQIDEVDEEQDNEVEQKNEESATKINDNTDNNNNNNNNNTNLSTAPVAATVHKEVLPAPIISESTTTVAAPSTNTIINDGASCLTGMISPNVSPVLHPTSANPSPKITTDYKSMIPTNSIPTLGSENEPKINRRNVEDPEKKKRIEKMDERVPMVSTAAKSTEKKPESTSTIKSMIVQPVTASSVTASSLKSQHVPTSTKSVTPTFAQPRTPNSNSRAHGLNLSKQLPPSPKLFKSHSQDHSPVKLKSTPRLQKAKSSSALNKRLPSQTHSQKSVDSLQGDHQGQNPKFKNFFKKIFNKAERKESSSSLTSTASATGKWARSRSSDTNTHSSNNSSISSSKITVLHKMAEPIMDDLTLTKLPSIEHDANMFDDMLLSFDEKFNRNSVITTKESTRDNIDAIFRDDELTEDQIADQQKRDGGEDTDKSQSSEDIVQPGNESGDADHLLPDHLRQNSDELYIDENILFVRNEVSWMDDVRSLLDDKNILARIPTSDDTTTSNDEQEETFLIDNEQLTNLFNNLTDIQRRSLPMHLKYIRQFKDFDTLEITVRTGRKPLVRGAQPVKPSIRRGYPGGSHEKTAGPTNKRHVTFGHKISVNETFAPELYKRYNKSVTQYTLTEPYEINKIKAELNHYKCNEMLVHEKSQNNTHFFY